MGTLGFSLDSAHLCWTHWTFKVDRLPRTFHTQSMDKRDLLLPAESYTDIRPEYWRHSIKWSLKSIIICNAELLEYPWKAAMQYPFSATAFVSKTHAQRFRNTPFLSLRGSAQLRQGQPAPVALFQEGHPEPRLPLTNRPGWHSRQPFESSFLRPDLSFAQMLQFHLAATRVVAKCGFKAYSKTLQQVGLGLQQSVMDSCQANFGSGGSCGVVEPARMPNGPWKIRNLPGWLERVSQHESLSGLIN